MYNRPKGFRIEPDVLKQLEKQLSVAKFSEDIAANLRLKASRAALQEVCPIRERINAK